MERKHERRMGLFPIRRVSGACAEVSTHEVDPAVFVAAVEAQAVGGDCDAQRRATDLIAVNEREAPRVELQDVARLPGGYEDAVTTRMHCQLGTRLRQSG